MISRKCRLRSVGLTAYVAIEASDHVVRTLRLRRETSHLMVSRYREDNDRRERCWTGASRCRAKAMKIKFTYSVGRGLLRLHDQTVTIEIEGDKLTYDTLHEAEQKFLARFRGEERENKLIEWKSGPIQGDGQYSEYRAHLPLSE